jgi:hypothetical protein
LFRDVVGALLFGNRLSSPAAIFLSVTGAQSKYIALHGNDLRLAEKIVVPSSGAPSNAIDLVR